MTRSLGRAIALDKDKLKKMSKLGQRQKVSNVRILRYSRDSLDPGQVKASIGYEKV